MNLPVEATRREQVAWVKSLSPAERKTLLRTFGLRKAKAISDPVSTPASMRGLDIPRLSLRKDGQVMKPFNP